MNEESDRTISSIVMALMLLMGGIVTLVSGFGYIEDPNVSDIVAALDIIAGIMLFVGCACQIIGGRPILWKVCFASLVVGIVSGVGMMTVTIFGGIVIVLICIAMIYWMHTRMIRPWFKI